MNYLFNLETNYSRLKYNRIVRKQFLYRCFNITSVILRQLLGTYILHICLAAKYGSEWRYLVLLTSLCKIPRADIMYSVRFNETYAWYAKHILITSVVDHVYRDWFCIHHYNLLDASNRLAINALPFITQLASICNPRR